MPQKRNSTPPPVTKWKKALWVLIMAGILDLLRLMCEFLVFFGPAFAGLYCAAKVGDVAVIGKVLTAGCAVGAAVLGIAGSEVTIVLGLVLAMAVGFAGWLTLGVVMMVSDARVLRGGGIRYLLSLFISEVPFVGVLPAFTFTTWRMYHKQIKADEAAYAAWGKENAATIARERATQAARTQQLQAERAQIAEEQQMVEAQEIADMQGAREARLAAEDAANDEIPDTARKAA